jgi:RHS repeat-associated protein
MASLQHRKHSTRDPNNKRVWRGSVSLFGEHYEHLDCGDGLLNPFFFHSRTNSVWSTDRIDNCVFASFDSFASTHVSLAFDSPFGLVRFCHLGSDFRLHFIRDFKSVFRIVGFFFLAFGTRISKNRPSQKFVKEELRVNEIVADGPAPLASYSYDLNGNRTAKNVAWASLPMHSEIYTYDPIDQLVTANYNGSNTVAYDYDPVGNRTSVSATASAPGVGTYTTNNLNQYTNALGKVNLHDSRGNLTKVGIDLTFAYDSKNRLTSAQNGTNTMTVTYDYRNRQVSRTINGTTVYFIYDGWSLLEERDATGDLMQKYVHGAQIDEILWKQNTTGEVYYHHDGLGSTIALTDETGAVVESYQYDAFGSVSIYDASNSALSASPRENRFLFTGREWIGEIGLYDYRNRVYSPELGRFLQTDAIRFEAGDVNLYRYVGNGAVDYWDPFGLEWTEKANSITLSGSWTSSSVSYRADGTPAANGYQILHVLGNYEAAASEICVCSETGAEESRTGVRIKTVDFNIGPMLIQVSMDVGSPAIRPPSFRDIMAGIGRIIGGGARTAIPVTPIPNQAQQDRIDGSQRRYTPSSRDLGDGWRGQSPCGG